MIAAGLVTVLVSIGYVVATRFSTGDANRDTRADESRSSVVAALRSSVVRGLRLGTLDRRWALALGDHDATSVTVLSEADVLDIFGQDLTTTLQTLATRDVDVLLIDRRVEDMHPWSVLDTPYFQPLFPDAAAHWDEAMEQGDLDGDGIAESFRTLLPLGWRNAVIYPLANPARSRWLILRAYFDQASTGPLVVRVNGVEVAATHLGPGQGGTWQTIRAQVPPRILAAVNKISVENLSRTANVHVDSIGFGADPEGGADFPPVSAYKVLRLREQATMTQMGDVDGNGGDELYDTVVGSREYPLFFDGRGDGELVMGGFVRQQDRIDTLRVFVNGAPLDPRERARPDGRLPRRAGSSLSAFVSRISVPSKSLRHGWNRVRIENRGEAAIYLQRIGLVPSEERGRRTVFSLPLSAGGEVGRPGTSLATRRARLLAQAGRPEVPLEPISPAEAHQVIERRVNADIGPIRLLGYRARVSSQKVRYEFLFLSTERMHGEYEFFAHFAVRNRPQVWFPTERKPVRTTRRWVPGQIYLMPVLYDLPIADYDVFIGWRDASSGARLRVSGTRDNRLRLDPIRVQK